MRLVSTICIALFCMVTTVANAQSLLDKKISVNYHDIKLEQVLDTIARNQGFFFSYNSTIVPADSMVTISVENKTVRQVLDYMFRGAYEYKEIEKHIIIRRPDAGQYWYISGTVTDGVTGERLRDVSVFESNQLVASLTNEQGYFKLRMKDRIPSVSLNISKSWYSDTAVIIKPGVDQQVNVSIRPKPIELDSVVIGSNDRVESTWWGKLFLSSKQRVQSINLNKFFVDVPFQASIIPGVGSHGKMGGQVNNVFSLNLFGGYSSGVEGLEVGSLFNVVKHDVKYVQVGGLVNIVGGRVTGVQAAGLHNNVLDTVVGVQAAGISNVVKGSVKGIQAAGIYNLAIGSIKGIQASGIINTLIDTMKGIQAAGVVNTSIKDVTGIQAAGIINSSVGEIRGIQSSGVINMAVKNITGAQMAGLINVSVKDIKGLQASGLINYARKIKGVQLGVFNYADSADVSIGVISIVRQGYHKASVFTDEVFPFNVAVKTGTHWLYNIYLAGASVGADNKAYTYGFGFGSELLVSKHFSINPEATGQGVYLGTFEDFNLLARLRINFNFHLNKSVAIYGGPSYSLYYNNQATLIDGYKTVLPSAGYKKSSWDYGMSSWLGWNVGLTFF